MTCPLDDRELDEFISVKVMGRTDIGQPCTEGEEGEDFDGWQCTCGVTGSWADEDHSHTIGPDKYTQDLNVCDKAEEKLKEMDIPGIESTYFEALCMAVDPVNGDYTPKKAHEWLDVARATARQRCEAMWKTLQ